MSSVFGLNARPHTRERAAAQVVAEALVILCTQHVLLRVVDVLDRFENAQLAGRVSRAVRISACTSFGKHEPP